ncbi:MAG: DNA ligase [Epsilonproteobacteria bacterium]|nr:DNA ligase [Campylobacterota bacterium]
MLKILLLWLTLFTLLSSSTISLQKPKTFRGDEMIQGWYMSEKLDGIRAYWDGKQLLSKNGNSIYAPQWFTKQFPPFKLDGELWSKQGDFEFIQSTVLDHIPSLAWKKITYQIFEVPEQEGDFPTRLQTAKAWFNQHRVPHVEIIPQIKCQNKAHLDTFLKDIETQGGEGVIIKNPQLSYHTGRTTHILKVKNFKDMEAKVIAIHKGKGKYKNIMGSLTLQLESGVTFKLGSGFSDAQRKSPPKIGDQITFKYYGLTKNNKPKFASFMRIRDKE